jgi:hypothetical protein
MRRGLTESAIVLGQTPNGLGRGYRQQRRRLPLYGQNCHSVDDPFLLMNKFQAEVCERWLKESITQRNMILLKVWSSSLPISHCPDIDQSVPNGRLRQSRASIEVFHGFGVSSPT